MRVFSPRSCFFQKDALSSEGIVDVNLLSEEGFKQVNTIAPPRAKFFNFDPEIARYVNFVKNLVDQNRERHVFYTVFDTSLDWSSLYKLLMVELYNKSFVTLETWQDTTESIWIIKLSNVESIINGYFEGNTFNIVKLQTDFPGVEVRRAELSDFPDKKVCKDTANEFNEKLNNLMLETRDFRSNGYISNVMSDCISFYTLFFDMPFPNFDKEELRKVLLPYNIERYATHEIKYYNYLFVLDFSQSKLNSDKRFVFSLNTLSVDTRFWFSFEEHKISPEFKFFKLNKSMEFLFSDISVYASPLIAISENRAPGSPGDVYSESNKIGFKTSYNKNYFSVFAKRGFKHTFGTWRR